jgi:tetratricopeptide (TPR) repeat protein
MVRTIVNRVWLLMAVLLACPGRTEGTAPPPGGVSRSFVEGIWLEHLWLQIDRVRDQPRAVERHARRVLVFKPGDRLALKAIIRSVLTRQEYQYAAVLCRFGQRVDEADPEWGFQLRRIESGLKDLRLLNEVPATRLAIMREQVAEADRHRDEAALRDLEGQLRDQLARHTADPGLLHALGAAYRALGEATLAAATLREAQALDPADFPLLQAATEALEAVGEGPRGQEAILASTRSLLLHRDFNAHAGRFLLRNGLGYLALGYLARWCSLDGENPAAWETLGLALEGMGEDNQARAAYIRAVSNAPAPAPMLRKLALLAAKDRNAAEAAVWIERLRRHVREEELLEWLLQPEFALIPELLQVIE